MGAGCMLPLSRNVNLSRDLGMRHRAGIGMSENSDAVVVIVSEETGSISVAIGGMLKRHLMPETLAKLLRNELMPQEEDEDDDAVDPAMKAAEAAGEPEDEPVAQAAADAEAVGIKLRIDVDRAVTEAFSLMRDMNVPYELKSILDLLEGRVYGKLTVGEIARELGKSESTVKALFSTYRDGGIMKYYNTLKIEEAKKLVREGKYNMAQIADRLGFENPQYFSKVFRQHTNMRYL